MKAEFELTDKDYEAIAEKAIQKLSDESFIKTLLKTSEEVAKDKYWHVLEKLHSEVEIYELLKKHMKDYIIDGINKNNLIGNELRKVLDSAEMRKVTIRELRRKAEELEQEANDLEELNQ